MSEPRRAAAWTATRALHVVHVGVFRDPLRRHAAELLEAWPTVVDVAEAAASAGLRVSVLQSSVHVEQHERAGIAYHFLPIDAERRNARSGLAALLAALSPDVLHVHGLQFASALTLLAACCPRTPLLVQDHANRVPRWWRRGALRRACAGLAGVAFCAREQAIPFLAAGVLQPHTRIYQIPESTSRFGPGDRDSARRAAALHGAPLLLWIGRLDENKDPLTVLEGVSRAAAALPDLRLYCCFGSATLLRPVQRRIAADPRLRDRVQLLGRLPHARIEQLMQAADLFVLGSHREGSGYALLEALACGLTPVVTDIAPFRALTGGGAAAGGVGWLWPCGEATALAAALRHAAAHTGGAERRAVHAHFARELCARALGGKLRAMYEDLHGAQQCPGGAARGVGAAAAAAARAP